MADESNMGPIDANMRNDVGGETPATKKKSSPPRRLKNAVKPSGIVSKLDIARSPPAKSRKYSEKEKIERLREIETKASGGTSTLKDAIKSAGISEQTYYNWKRAAKPTEDVDEKSFPPLDELADFVQLDEENQRLRKLLAEKLRTENAALRKRLGLD